MLGIGGGLPSTEFCLGDVTVATRIQDLRVMALLEDKEPEVDSRGGPVEPEVERVVNALQRIKLGAWNSPTSIGAQQPSVRIVDENFYGSAAWQKKVMAVVIARFGSDGTKIRRPLFTTGAFVSTDNLVKETATAERWQRSARKALSCEMETAGVFQGARTVRRTYPVYGIRGISDVIGFKRENEWTAYACESAAAFTFALIRTGVVAAKGSRHILPTDQEATAVYVKTKSSLPRRSRPVSLSYNQVDSFSAQAFRPALSFIDRGEVEAAVSAILAGMPYDRAEPIAQLSIAAAWQKFGFLDEARKCLDILTAQRHFSRLNPQQQAHCRVIELKSFSQAAEFVRVRDSYESVLKSLAQLNLHEHRAAVYRRAAVAYAALGNSISARKCVWKAQSIDATLPGKHSRTTGEVFAAITLTLGTKEPTSDAALKILKEAPDAYLTGELDRSSFQAHPLKSAVMCLFSEAAVRMVINGESPAAWICLTASYVLAPIGSAHPKSEGYAELLGLLHSRQEYWDLFRMAMSSESAQRRDFLTKYSNASRYLARCQTLPDLAQGKNSETWAAMRRYLDNLISQEISY
jgi:nucleoside phosphorylase/tetratricopeptide (TPR) repeat protein